MFIPYWTLTMSSCAQYQQALNYLTMPIVNLTDISLMLSVPPSVEDSPVEKSRQRARSQKLIVIFPSGPTIFHSTSKSTYLETLRRIGGDKLSKVGLEISHLPIFTRTPYQQFAKYMEPIDNGWYVLCIGGTSSKYLQLCTISDALNLGLQINITDTDPFVRTDKVLQMVKKLYPGLDLGERKAITSNTLIVTYQDKTYDFLHHNSNAQLSCVIEAIGPSRVYRLGLKVGSKDLLMTYRICKTQNSCGAYWLNSPSSIHEKRKLLYTIKTLLHLDLTIELLTGNTPNISSRQL